MTDHATEMNGSVGTGVVHVVPDELSRARGMVAPPERQRVLCERIARGEMLHDVCRDLGCDRSTPWRWAQADPVFAREYFAARVMGAHAIAEEAQRVADGADLVTGFYEAVIEWAVSQEVDRNIAAPLLNVLRNAEVQLRKLRIDTLRWRASKIAPANYGRAAEDTPASASGDTENGRVRFIVVQREGQSGAVIGKENGRVVASLPARLSEEEACEELERLCDAQRTSSSSEDAVRFAPALGRVGGAAGAPERLTMEERAEQIVRMFCATPEGKAKVLTWAGSPEIAYTATHDRFRRGAAGPGDRAAEAPCDFAALSDDEKRRLILEYFDNDAHRRELVPLLDVPDDPRTPVAHG